MNEGSKHLDNNELLEVLLPRRPGRPKGLPKPPGSGRQKGTPNKVGLAARELAAKHTPKAFATLAKLLDSSDPRVAAMAAQQILDRRFGKPISPTEITGRDGAPLLEPAPMSDIELARLVTFSLSKAVQTLGSDGEAERFDAL